jgi:hypothetical protein
VVTPLTVPPFELPLELELEELLDCVLEPDVDPVDPELEVVTVLVAGVELDATVVADERLASAGSWPDTSTTVIISHAATNSATAPPMMRRRIILARLSRAPLIVAARARASCALSSIMSKYLVVSGRNVSVASTPPLSGACERPKSCV